jgi:hypothetical protein
MESPRRRHHLTLDLEADSLAELVGLLHYLADEIDVEGRDHRDIRSLGHAASYTATLRTGPSEIGPTERRRLGEHGESA